MAISLLSHETSQLRARGKSIPFSRSGDTPRSGQDCCSLFRDSESSHRSQWKYESSRTDKGSPSIAFGSRQSRLSSTWAGKTWRISDSFCTWGISAVSTRLVDDLRSVLRIPQWSTGLRCIVDQSEILQFGMHAWFGSFDFLNSTLASTWRNIFTDLCEFNGRRMSDLISEAYIGTTYLIYESVRIMIWQILFSWTAYMHFTWRNIWNICSGFNGRRIAFTWRKSYNTSLQVEWTTDVWPGSGIHENCELGVQSPVCSSITMQLMLLFGHGSRIFQRSSHGQCMICFELRQVARELFIKWWSRRMAPSQRVCGSCCPAHMASYAFSMGGQLLSGLSLDVNLSRNLIVQNQRRFYQDSQRTRLCVFKNLFDRDWDLHFFIKLSYWEAWPGLLIGRVHTVLSSFRMRS